MYKNQRDILLDYLKKIGEFPLLNTEEEIELSKKIKKGSEKEKEIALNKLINGNLRLVVNIAKKYVSHNGSFMDLVQEGNMGLIKAAKKYDYKRGCRFSTYATWWIKQTIIRSILNTKKTIRLPVHIEEKIKKIEKFKKEYIKKYNYEPSIEKIAEKFNLSTRQIEDIIKAMSIELVSLDMPIGDDLILEDYIPSKNDNIMMEQKVNNHLLKNDVKELLKCLTPKERDIIIGRYGLDIGYPMTLQELGDKFGYSKERIRQLEVRALKKLKVASKGKNLTEYIR